MTYPKIGLHKTILEQLIGYSLIVQIVKKQLYLDWIEFEILDLRSGFTIWQNATISMSKKHTTLSAFLNTIR